MISEIDIRDWEKVDFKAIKHVMDNFHEDWPEPLNEEKENILFNFIEQMELLRDKQIQQATKHISAVEKKGFHGTLR